MTIREFAKYKNFKIIGKLKRIKDAYYGVGDNHYPVYIDEANNEYCMSNDGKSCECIITYDGGVL